MTLAVVPRGTLVRVVDELLGYARQELAKASLPDTLEDRNARFAEFVPEFAAELVAYFDAFLARAGIAKDAAFPFDPDTIDWVAERGELGKVIARWYVRLGELAFGHVGEQLGIIELTFDLGGPETAGVRGFLGQQITKIDEATRILVADKVEAAIAHGLSVDELVRGTGDFTGLRDVFGSRAKTIALTETANAYNQAALAGYVASDLVEEVLVFDGPECGWTTHDDPDLADGSQRALDEAQAYPISHPNCQRAFGPVVLR